MRQPAQYAPLPHRSSSEDDVLSEPLLEEKPHAQLAEDHTHVAKIITWSAIGVACSTALSIILAFIMSFKSSELHASPGLQTAGVPLRPNPYMYLDKLLVNTTETFPPITNFPQVMFQIDAADPSRLMREDERGRATYFGAVYPEDRHVLITAEVSTVVQFRNLDYAMERCVLNMSLPSDTTAFDPAITVDEGCPVEVWMLENTPELAQDIAGPLSAAPARHELLTTVPFPTSGSRQSRAFRCPSGTFTTVEFACALGGMPCRVDFWQDRKIKPVGGGWPLAPNSSCKGHTADNACRNIHNSVPDCRARAGGRV
ncbi:hypothetical protein BD413DRAFT_472031 [Trametes elegans]|nr:hypothetical protein BD413DRAFT_472031 [Trametes elegans]